MGAHRVMRVHILGATTAALLISRAALGQTATQVVTFQVDPVNQIAVSGAPSLVINSATAGSGPASVQSAGAAWAVTTNQTGAKITASIASSMPTGLTLSAQLTAPTGASSAGLKPLGTTAMDLVTGLTKLNSASLNLIYQLDATAAAGVSASSTRVVTYTITGGV